MNAKVGIVFGLLILLSVGAESVESKIISGNKILYQPPELERITRLANITARSHNWTYGGYACTDFTFHFLRLANRSGLDAYFVHGLENCSKPTLLYGQAHAWASVVLSNGTEFWVETVRGMVFPAFSNSCYYPLHVWKQPPEYVQAWKNKKLVKA